MTTENEITALGEFNKKFENTYELFKKNLENDEEVGHHLPFIKMEKFW